MPTLNLLYQSHNESNERNRPRSRTSGLSSFMRRKTHKRRSAWWSDGTTMTQSTRPELQASEALATVQSSKGTELTSIPSSSTTNPSRIVVWEHHSSAIRAVAPSPTSQPLSPVSTRSHFSGRFSSRASHMPMGSLNSQARSPTRRSDHGTIHSPIAQNRSPPPTPGKLEEGPVHEAEANPIPSPAGSEETSLSPTWPFTQPYESTGTSIGDHAASLQPPATLSPPPWHRNTFGRMEQYNLES